MYPLIYYESMTCKLINETKLKRHTHITHVNTSRMKLQNFLFIKQNKDNCLIRCLDVRVQNTFSNQTQTKVAFHVPSTLIKLSITTVLHVS